MATLDLDDLTPERSAESIEALKALGARTAIYSTASHTAQKPRLRAVIFLAEDVSRDDYPHLIERLAARLPPGAVSSESLKPTQIMYLPQRCSDGEEVFLELPGEPLDVAPLLAEPRVSAPVDDRAREVTPAWDKPGIVGVVARRYEGDLDTAIEELGIENVPYEQASAGPTCAIGEMRYTRVGASGADGAIWYPEDGHLFSHHGKSDPGAGDQQTIFDIVRLTRFKDLDEGLPAATPIHQLPSHKAAAAWFIERFPEMAESIPEDEFGDLDKTEPLAVDSSAKVKDAVTQELKGRKPLQFETLPDDVLTRQFPERKYVLYPYIPDLTVSGLSSIGGFGKTHLMLLLAVCKALGLPYFCDRECEPGRVVVFSAEDDLLEMYRRTQRILQYVQGLGATIDMALLRSNLQFIDMTGAGVSNLLTRVQRMGVVPTDLVTHIANQVGKAALIVFDTQSRFSGGPENDNAAAAVFISACETIATMTKAAVLVLSHTGKAVAREGIVDQYVGRGASAFSDNARSVMVLAPPLARQLKEFELDAEAVEREEEFRLVHVKNSYGRKASDVFLRRLGNGVVAPFTPPVRAVATEEDRTWQLLEHVGTKETTRNHAGRNSKGIFGQWFTREGAFHVFDEAKSRGLLVLSGKRNNSEQYGLSKDALKTLRERQKAANKEFDEPADYAPAATPAATKPAPGIEPEPSAPIEPEKKSRKPRKAAEPQIPDWDDVPREAACTH